VNHDAIGQLLRALEAPAVIRDDVSIEPVVGEAGGDFLDSDVPGVLALKHIADMGHYSIPIINEVIR
jgi:hypothetical protein